MRRYLKIILPIIGHNKLRILTSNKNDYFTIKIWSGRIGQGFGSSPFTINLRDLQDKLKKHLKQCFFHDGNFDRECPGDGKNVHHSLR